MNGLTSAEVAQRVSDGRVNLLPPRTGRTVGDIVRSNVFTRINAMLSVLFVLVMLTGSIINGAFGLLIIVNSAIGIIQELRAKRTLESLSLIGEEHPKVLRDGEVIEISQQELVLDDVIELRSGNQIVVDGELIQSDLLSLDESMLTGESDPIRKQPGDEVMSGSFVISGIGYYRVTKVGAESYAAKLTEEASKFTLSRSRLQQGIDRILKYITWILIPVGLLTIWSQIRGGGSDWRDIILQITGALVPMIPEGLILITTTAFALGVIRLGKRQCLVQELPAIEGLARVDVVCADKTGTLTENRMVFSRLELVDGGPNEATILSVLAQIGASDNDPNATMRAIKKSITLADGESAWTVAGRQPFTSARKWSGITFAEGGSWILGAPDIVGRDSELAEIAEKIGEQGYRVIALASCGSAIAEGSDPFAIAGNVVPRALIVLEQKIRPDAAQTLAYFADQDVSVKVISGDNARSVGAVTRSLGVDTDDAIDARAIAPEDFDRTIEESHVFGRVTPEQKRDMVGSLQRGGHTVAMTGDGVNDVLALKDADIGVAMGSGSPATRAVAKIVLLDDRFATLPHVVAEGRRVIGNIERVANLFLTKTVYSATLAMLVIVFAVPFPFQPIHVTITGWFTIGIPAFLLSLPPNYDRARDGFVRRVLYFAMPAGVVVGVASFVTYWIVSEGGKHPADSMQDSTAALLTLIISSTWVLACVCRPWNWWKGLIVVLPFLGYGVIFNWSITQEIFKLDSSNLSMMETGAIIGGIAVVCIEIIWRMVKQVLGPRK